MIDRPCLLEVQRYATKDGPVGKVWPDTRLFLELAVAVVLELHALIEQVLNTETGDAVSVWEPIADANIHDEEAVMSLVLELRQTFHVLIHEGRAGRREKAGWMEIREADGNAEGLDLERILILDTRQEVFRFPVELVIGEAGADRQLVERGPVDIHLVQLLVRVDVHNLVLLIVDKGFLNIAPGYFATDREIRRDLPIRTETVATGLRGIGVVKELIEAGDLRRLQGPVRGERLLDGLDVGRSDLKIRRDTPLNTDLGIEPAHLVAELGLLVEYLVCFVAGLVIVRVVQPKGPGYGLGYVDVGIDVASVVVDAGEGR